MQFALRLGSVAVAASLALAACSTTGSQAVPGASQSVTAPTSHHIGHLAPVGVRDDQGQGLGTCPGSTQYFGNYCYYVAAGSSVSQEWEEENTSGGQLSGNWYWKFCHTYKVKDNKGYKLSKCSWGPNPANPNTQTVTMASGAPISPPSGPPPYYVTIKACSNNSPYGKGYCDGPYELGVMVIAPSGS